MSESYRRISKLFAVALMVLTLGAVPALAQGTDTGPSPAQLEDAELYAELYGITVDQALHRLDVQRAAGELDADLREGDAQSFGGLWIEHEPFHVVARFRGAAQVERQLQERLKGSLLDGLVEVRQAAFTLTQLEDKLETVHGRVRELGLAADVAIDVRENRVNVLTPDPQGVRGALASAGKIPAGVEVVEVAELVQPEATLHGGTHASTCTGGFTVRRYNGDLGISTAAHCGNTQYFLGTSLPFRSADQQGNQDVQWHSACKIHDVDNQIQTGSGLRSITATRHRDYQAIGGLVCKYGMTTGRTCGEIDYKTYAPHWVTSAASTFIYVDGDRLGVNLSEGGDSGGPWYLEHYAYGIHSGGGGNDSIYMAINYISSIGVSVLTYDPGPGCNLDPNAYFTYTVNNSRVDFDASSSSDSDGSIVSYQWDFGDGYTKTTTSPTTYHYYSSGTYWVSLVVVDNEGATDSYTRYISVGDDCQEPYLTYSSSTLGAATEALIVPCQY